MITSLKLQTEVRKHAEVILDVLKPSDADLQVVAYTIAAQAAAITSIVSRYILQEEAERDAKSLVNEIRALME